MADDSFFVVIEGIDGAGKTSVARALNNILRQTLGDSVLLTEEPHNKSLMGTEIRSALRRERELRPVELAQAFALNRSNHLKTVIECHLQKEHAVVICDRYLLSSLVYQTRDEITMEDVYQINRWARVPDLTIVLQVSPTLLTIEWMSAAKARASCLRMTCRRASRNTARVSNCFAARDKTSAQWMAMASFQRLPMTCWTYSSKERPPGCASSRHFSWNDSAISAHRPPLP